MPIGPGGESLPYPGEQGPPMGDPAMGGAPPAPAGPQFPSLDPGQMAAMAMQVIAQMAGMDQQQIQQLLAEQAQQFAMQQEQAISAMPGAIAAIVARLSEPAPESLDEPGGMMEPTDMSAQGAPAGPSDEEMMMAMQAQGALG